MVVPVVAGIPLVYEMLVGAGILAGGAVAANQMQKEIQTTIDKNPEIIDQALKNIFTGPASRLIDPNFLKEMQAKKPTPTNQGQTNWSDSFKKKAPAAEEDIMKGSLFYEQTPSGIYLGPTVGGIEKGREEARSKPLITPMPVGQQDQTLVTPVPEKTTVLPGMDPAPPSTQNKGFSLPTTEDMSILYKVENEDDDTENTTTDKFITKDKVSVTNNLKTQNFLEDKVMNKLLTMRGGSVEGFKELFKRAAPMPASTKAKMEMELQKILFDKYKINEYPEGESPETVHELRKKYLMDTYHKRMGAIEYISSVAYDVIGEKSNNSLLVVDDDGIPLAGAKIAIPGTKDYNRSDIFSKDALVITEAGSVFKNAGDQLMKDIIQRAKDEGRRFVVAEDLTSEGALDAFMNRGFRTPTTKETKKFKGIKIRRPDGRSAVQKNLVLDLKEIEKNTSKSAESLIDKPAQIELPDKAALKEESKLGDELFKLSETGTVQDYETFKNNPIIKKKIALSKQLYKDTTANPGYGTAEYWADRPFTKGVNGYKELVKKVYDRKKIKNNKEFYIVMGPSSAGKSTGLVDKLQKETGSFLADSDEIKKLIPEFNNGYNANGVHKESSDINSRILAMAMKAGDNVIYPTTGREAGKLKGIIDNAEKRGYKVYVDLVTADRSVLLLRNLARMLKTNRVVNGDELLTEEVINGILETYNNLDEKYKRGEPIDTTPKK
jgi:predicted ABC-type ATPase